MLSQENGDGLSRRYEPDEPAVVVDDREAAASVARQPGCGEFLVDVDAHDVGRPASSRQVGQKPLRAAVEGHEADKSVAVAHGEVDGAGKRAADEVLDRSHGVLGCARGTLAEGAGAS